MYSMQYLIGKFCIKSKNNNHLHILYTVFSMYVYKLDMYKIVYYGNPFSGAYLNAFVNVIVYIL